MESIKAIGRGDRNTVLPLLLAVLGGAGLSILGFLLYYLCGGLNAAYPPLLWQGQQMTVTLGQSQSTAQGLEIQSSGAESGIVFWFSKQAFIANPYGALTWNIEGLQPSQDIRLLWRIQTDANTIWQASLQSADLEKGAFDLRAQPHWKGYVVGFGLSVRGSFAKPLRVRWLKLLPQTLGIGALLRQAWEEWATSEYWSQRSTHYISGAPRRALFHPLIMVVVWIGFSAALYGGWLWKSQRRFIKLPVLAALFLLGWWILDFRWQIDLLQRSIVTHERFADKDPLTRKQAADDGELFQFLKKVRDYLPVTPARILIVNDDAANRAASRNYMVARARYHLQPHNSFADITDWEQLSQAKDGDYVLILRPDKGQRPQQARLRYDSERHLLLWASGQLPVEVRYTTLLGTLFQVRKPE